MWFFSHCWKANWEDQDTIRADRARDAIALCNKQIDMTNEIQNQLMREVQALQAESRRLCAVCSQIKNDNTTAAMYNTKLRGTLSWKLQKMARFNSVNAQQMQFHTMVETLKTIHDQLISFSVTKHTLETTKILTSAISEEDVCEVREKLENEIYKVGSLEKILCADLPGSVSDDEIADALAKLEEETATKPETETQYYFPSVNTIAPEAEKITSREFIEHMYAH
jgi:FtsZ-binding cell division protein ZapB